MGMLGGQIRALLREVETGFVAEVPPSDGIRVASHGPLLCQTAWFGQSGWVTTSIA
jgi:hypothetical protein